jgi:hypothetical protein
MSSGRSREGQVNPKQSGRRKFLRDGATLAGLAVGAAGTGSAQVLVPETHKFSLDDLHAYGERSRYVKSVRIGSINNPDTRRSGDRRDVGLRTPLQDSVGMITPASLHFIVSHGYEPPDIDPRRHQLMIHGMRSALIAAQGSRHAKRRELDRGRRGRSEQALEEHPT